MDSIDGVLCDITFLSDTVTDSTSPRALLRIDAKDIVTLRDSDLWKCSDLCPNYGDSFSCTPLAPRPVEMEKLLSGYRKVLVALFDLDPKNWGEHSSLVTRQTNDCMIRLEDDLKSKGYAKARSFFVYPCDVCNPCHATYHVPDADFSAFCMRPSYMRPLAETCIDVYKTLDKAHISINVYDRLHPERNIDMVGLILLE